MKPISKYLDFSGKDFTLTLLILFGVSFWVFCLYKLEERQANILQKRIEAVEKQQKKDEKIKQQQQTIRELEAVLQQSACYTTAEVNKCKNLPK